MYWNTFSAEKLGPSNKDSILESFRLSLRDIMEYDCKWVNIFRDKYTLGLHMKYQQEINNKLSSEHERGEIE